uniref:Peptidase M3A/M3B catalytic domain-containing protein n=1 Tax=viral metagenome TaxID=1070528 RepID=A0A6C0CM86_9ZZZZ
MSLPQVKFDYTADEIVEQTKNIISTLTEFYDELEKRPVEDCTFENTVKRSTQVEDALRTKTQDMNFLQNVSTSKEIRDASRKSEELLSAFGIESVMRLETYKRYKHVYDNEYDQLSALDQRLLDKELKGFQKYGVHLPEDSRAKLKELYDKKNVLQQTFSKNIAEDDACLMLTKEELDGVPEDFLTRTLDVESQKHKITYKYPDVSPVLRYCHSEETRRKVQEMSGNRCPQNIPILREILEIRQEIAEILGFANNSDYVLQNQILKSGKKVTNFLESLLSELAPHSKKFIESLRELKGSSEFNCWDFSYYNQKKLKSLEIDMQVYKQYFPAEHTFQMMLGHYAEVFSLKFQEVTGLAEYRKYSWHPTVKTYTTSDSNGELLGLFSIDLYPREGKYTHFAMWDVAAGFKDADGNQILPFATLVGNFNNPVGDKPSLLSVDEVQTMFHEFGHVIHGICGGADSIYSSMAGTNTETDFVECPSQMLEQWVYEPKILKKLSKHYKDETPLTDEMINRLVEFKTYGNTYKWTRQATMALTDQVIHGAGSDSAANGVKVTDDYLRSVLNDHFLQYTGLGTFPNTMATWGHVGGGYDSRYYSYTLTILLACDLYTRFEADPFSQSAGMDYRNKILKPGNTRDGMDHVTDFLGRSPSFKPFMMRFCGIPEDQIADLDLDF